MAELVLNVVCEDDPQEEVIKKLFSIRPDFRIDTVYRRNGNRYIIANINHFNEDADNIPYFILTDLDYWPCPPGLMDEWLDDEKHPNLIFRIAVHSVESWLMADFDNFSHFFRIPNEEMRRDLEEIIEPQKYLLFLIDKYSTKEFKDAMLPKKGAKIGRQYNAYLTEFINKRWNYHYAERYSKSLRHALRAICLFRI